jgi:hypothetical protein
VHKRSADTTQSLDRRPNRRVEAKRKGLETKGHHKARAKRPAQIPGASRHKRRAGRTRTTPKKKVRRVHEAPELPYKLVIAGNYRQYEQWLDINNLDRNRFRFIDQVQELRGRPSGLGILLVGAFDSSPLIAQHLVEIDTLAKQHEYRVSKADWNGYVDTF